MSKAVIYIDINDDITSIIDKIEQVPDKIVALVPPKQIGVLHSAINLQLLAKVAREKKKYLVIITGRESLVKLAAVAKIPVAKTLQSKPEIAKLPSFDLSNDDLIEGEQQPVGELAGDSAAGTVKTEEIIADPNAPIADDKKPVKVPNFNKFRKKLLIGGGAALAVILFLVWAIFFAPKATVNILAKAKIVNVSQLTTLTEDSTKANFDQHSLHVQIQKLDKKRNLEFLATGSKDIGGRATGKITLARTDMLPIAQSLPAGTVFKSENNCLFMTSTAVTVPGATLASDGSGVIRPPVSVVVTADEPGEKCNVGEQVYKSGLPGVSAKGSATSGGSTKVVKIVTQDDLDQAKQKLAKLGDEEAKKELRNRFEASAIVINESLIIGEGDIKPSVAVDQEAPNGKASLEQPVSYQLMAVVRSQLTDYLTSLAVPKDQRTVQKVYEAGDNHVQFSDFAIKEGGASVKVITQAKVGPNITEDDVKEFAKGKTLGEIQDKYQNIEGVKTADVDFSPFWVRKVPKKTSRIFVKFSLDK